MSYKNPLAPFFFSVLNWTGSWHNYSSFLKPYALIFFTFFCLFSLCISFTLVISVRITHPPSTVCIHGYHHDHDCHIYHKRINHCSGSFIYMLKLIFDMSLQDSYTYVLHVYVMCVCVYLWVWVCVKYTYVLDERMWSEK